MLLSVQKQALHRTADPVPHRAATYEEFFSWCSRHHCPYMEVGAYDAVGCLCAAAAPGAESAVYDSVSLCRWLSADSRTFALSVRDFVDVTRELTIKHYRIHKLA